MEYRLAHSHGFHCRQNKAHLFLQTQPADGCAQLLRQRTGAGPANGGTLSAAGAESFGSTGLASPSAVSLTLILQGPPSYHCEQESAFLLVCLLNFCSSFKNQISWLPPAEIWTSSVHEIVVSVSQFSHWIVRSLEERSILSNLCSKNLAQHLAHHR